MFQIPQQKKSHKFMAKQTIVNGIKFPSKAEANRYVELSILKQAGQIKDFERQPVFKLHAGIKYVADFKVIYNDGHEEIEDVKGMETPVFRLKEKLFKADYPDVVLRVIGRKEKKKKEKKKC